ncbi:AAA family ATPase [Microbacterium sp. NPDC056003]|uniref:AAA family ATPase n=1 Tax=Microbacterium sp. NPDC056003 TaxID=3345676 RepID=UPI0035D67225
MRGGLERWKRGVGSQGVRQALAYAFQGSCDSHLRTTVGVEALAAYGDAGSAGVTRYVVEGGSIGTDALDEQQLRRWVDGRDPDTDERRGRDLTSPDADLILDGTINAPKSYSIAAMINFELAREFEALQDRLRDRIVMTWQSELNARRGAGGRIRESLHRIEVVELQHRRSRALDPHIHRHLWLNVKVLGEDRKWSNADSRVAMKMQTVINAEGELAARTDPQWVSALARHGFTIDADGEIAELAHAVRPLSRRSTQIESNRAVLLAAWRSEHPGLEPSPDELHRIDRLAWAKARPNKPGKVDEAAWEQLIADELVAIDSTILRERGEVPLPSAELGELDLELLAARAVVEADARSASCGGRFSLFAIRAGATRAVAASGVVAPRGELQGVIDDVIDRALEQTVDLLDGEPERPAHIKGYMASATAVAKVELAARFGALALAGVRASEGEIADAAATVLSDGIKLEGRQVEAAAAIAGTDRLVSVTGPAGAGKTTMLRVARAALAHRGRCMVVVAPTKKAASVAGREIGASASSLHALLGDHGFRWGRDAAGAEIWTRLQVGEIDSVTGIAYEGPKRYALVAGDRIVVDEAGMVDLHAANALAAIAAESGAGIAMVGDHLQARPVGHSGAMATMTRRATAVVELTAVHRFTDPKYATLTLRMREPASKDAALAVATDLADRGLVHRVSDHVQARDVMVESYFRWAAGHRRVALVTSTNEEADAINEAIQQRRVEHGELPLARIAVGQGEQRLLEGDVVQTRRNDRATGVENRAVWVVRRITPAGLELASVSDAVDTRVVRHEYAADHVHLAYASTVHGIQGETTDASIVGPGVDASGLYVGMTRGRVHNEAIAIARTDAAATDQIAESMMRGIPEVSIDDSVRAARSELGRAARPAERAVGDDLRQLNEWMRTARRTLLSLDSQVAAQDAGAHGRAGGDASGGDLADVRSALRARYESAWQRHEELLRQYLETERGAVARGHAEDVAAPVAAPEVRTRSLLGR